MGTNPLAKVKAEGQTERFESSSYGFESSWRKIQISLRQFESPTQQFESFLAQNSNLAQVIQILYTTIRIPDSAEALNTQLATPSTLFSSQISLIMAN